VPSSTFAATSDEIQLHDRTHLSSPVPAGDFLLFSLLSQNVGIFVLEEVDTEQKILSNISFSRFPEKESASSTDFATIRLVFGIASGKFEVKSVESQHGFTFLFNNMIWNTLVGRNSVEIHRTARFSRVRCISK
jgi:hypothetical protein